MKRVPSFAGLALTFVALVLVQAAAAQQAVRNPQIGYVYPAGACRGTTAEVTVGGQMLAGVNGALFSGTGIRAQVLGHKRPLTMAEVNRLRERLEEAQKKLYPDLRGRPALRAPLRPADILRLRELAREAGITDAQLQALEEFRRRRNDPKRQPNPQIEEEVTLRIEVDPDAAPGVRELRLQSPIGLTNPIRFIVGSTPEIREIEPNDRLPDCSIGDKLPVVINGQIMPGDVDRFTVRARKGMRLVAVAQARDLTPYLADAVPGWFQSVLALYDAQGREVAYEDDFQFRPDPVLRVVIPADGDYTLVIRDSIYRGREDFVYRITLGELPFVTGIYPLGVRKGQMVAAKLGGWNLPVQTVMLNGNEVGVHSLSVRAADLPSNEVAYRVDDLPEVNEKEPNDTGATAMSVRLSVIINGKLDRPGDADVYRIAGRKGDRIVAEVVARRLGSPADTVLEVTDSRGKRLAFNDDFEDRGVGLITHHSDSYVMAVLPADGVYGIRLTEAQGKGGPDYAYRLRISAPMPDFELRVTPASVFARAGSCVPFTAHVIRRDGFDGPVDLALLDAPGFTLSGARIPAGCDKVPLTLICAPTNPSEPVALRLVGRAKAGDRQLQHEALPAQEMMQAFAYTHLVPAKQWTVAVAGRAFGPGPLPFDPDQPVRIPAGGSASVRVRLPSGPLGRQVTIRLADGPEGVTVAGTDLAASTITLRADGKLAKVGLRGNLLLQVLMGRPAASANPAAARMASFGYLPAIPFEVVPPPGR